MPFVLSFDKLFDYDTQRTGITVETTLKFADKEVKFDAKIDTGATDCIFARKFGEEIGLNVEQGNMISVSTATGNFRAFMHEITLSVLGFDFEIYALFAENESFERNVLGRAGFLDRVVLGLVDYEHKLYLNRYNYFDFDE
jgi:predicted aspartyl protease